ncbi:hypothetical protein HK104_005910 [Borealophlyctis nickersoniae]|nr:hypothetical protein HK104_005910 [Borealophlyctis nickersoniae]
MSDWAEKKLESISYGYLKLQCPKGECHGILAVLRICFAASLFHLIMSGIMYNVQSSRDFRSSIQNGFWAWKILAWAGFVVMAFFIPNEFFMGWGKYIDMPGAGLFVLIQIVLLIDFAYTFSESLLERWEDTEDKKYLAFLVTLTFGAFIASIVLTGVLYGYFGSSACKLNQFFISFNWVLCLGIACLSIAPVIQEANPKSGLAQAAMVTIYATYLIASAIMSEPVENDDNRCNPINEGSKTQTTTIVLGSLFTFIALAYSTSRAATQGSVLTSSDESSLPLISDRSRVRDAVDSGALPSRALDDDDDDDGSHYPADDEKDAVQYSYSFFHIIFALAAMYIAMLITNWDMVEKSGGVATVGRSMGAVWVKVASSWAVILLYGWTLLAPVLLPDRF